jgi:PAS domain-containing protein/two-component sensor histidine kinase
METIDIFLIVTGVSTLLLIGFTLTLFFGKRELNLVKQELNETKVALNHFQEKSSRRDTLFQSAKEVVAGGLLVIDQDEKVVVWNQKFLDHWELSNEELKQSCTWESITRYFGLHNDADIQRALIAEIMQDRTHSTHGEIALVNGTTLIRNSTPLIDKDGVYHGRLWEFIDITDSLQRKQDLVTVQKDLKEKSNFPHALLEASVHGFLFVDFHWRVVTFNTLFCEMWDLSEDMVYIGADGYEVLRYCMRKVSNSEVFMSNLQMIVNTQNIIWNNQIYLLNGKIFQSDSSPVYGLDGTYHGRIWEVMDITGSVQREQVLVAVRKDLVEKNDLLHTLLGTATHGILAVDSHWRVITLNKLFCEIWNLSEDVVYVGADGIEILRSYCMRRMKNPEIFVSNSRKISDALNMFWNNHLYLENDRILNSFSAPITGLDGTFNGRIWEVADITDELFQQQELERSYATLIQKDYQLTLALEGAEGGLWTWETNTNLFTLNPEFASQYRSLCQVQPIEQFFLSIPSGEQERYLHLFHDITKNTRIEFEFQLQTHTGMWRWLMLRGVVSDVDDDGSPLLVTGILMDITERKQYEKHLRDLNKKMLVLSQITRHDIVNQLNNLSFLTDALSDTLSNRFFDAPSDRPSDALSHKLSVLKLLELMNQGLVTVIHQVKFSKDYQEIGAHGAEWQDLNACIEMMKLLLINPPFELLANNLPKIFADPLLEKAVYNLIENSLRHGERVTQIKVTFSVEDGYNGILTFEDNGVGVPDVHKNRIFDKDFGKNTGLGLFLIREIFSLTGMTIHECGQPGSGARFDIKIPCGSWKW